MKLTLLDWDTVVTLPNGEETNVFRGFFFFYSHDILYAYTKVATFYPGTSWIWGPVNIKAVVPAGLMYAEWWEGQYSIHNGIFDLTGCQPVWAVGIIVDKGSGGH
jgi:hypothetical protein